MERRHFLRHLALGSVALAASLPAVRTARADVETQVTLIETFRTPDCDRSARYLLLRAVSDDGERFTDVVGVSNGWPIATAYVCNRSCTIEQFEVLNADIRCVAIGTAFDTTGKIARTVAGQTVLMNYAAPPPAAAAG